MYQSINVESLPDVAVIHRACNPCARDVATLMQEKLQLTIFNLDQDPYTACSDDYFMACVLMVCY